MEYVLTSKGIMYPQPGVTCRSVTLPDGRLGLYLSDTKGEELFLVEKDDCVAEDHA